MLIPILSILCALLAVALVISTLRRAGERRQDAEEKARLADKHRADMAEQVQENLDLLNALSDPFILLDHEGILRFANTPADDLFSGRPLLDRHFDEIFVDRALAEPVRSALSARKAVTAQVILTQEKSSLGNEDQPGESAWLVDARPVDSTRPQGLFRVIIRNTTTEYHTEQVRKDFVANASHELRTPLAIINGYLENLIEEELLGDQDTSLRFLKIMRKHGQRIARIVEDMLIISRLESGEAGTLKVSPFRLESCAQDVLERLESVIAAQRATVALEMEDPDLCLVGDRFYWTQILFNLVENALKQNPENPLRVAVGWCAEDDHSVRIWVADDGVGIPTADLPFIFRRFYRVEKHHSQIEIKGTGLGLSIVRRAVEAHGGEIEVASNPGQETRFSISLPPGAITRNHSLEKDKAPNLSP